MWTFIDTITGVAYDGRPPYVFWFENGQSTNLNYVKQICIYTNKKTFNVRIDSPIFSILKMDQLIPSHERVVLNKKSYIDLNDLKTNSWTSVGYYYDNAYVHMLYILCNSQDAGQYIDDLYIDGDLYKIGADFYVINELLQSNLENFEITLPESIQRAIYEVNIHEESNDNITLNRKYKELLMNYWDIVANKGSYQSLINSLKWFEWGDLVRIEEIWRNKEPHGDVLKFFDLKTQINSYMLSQLKNLNKTTYIGLYYALYKLRNENKYQDSTGQEYTPPVNFKTGFNVVNTPTGLYDDPDILPAQLLQQDNIETNITMGDIDETDGENKFFNEMIPQLEHTISLWNNLDIALKMTLLGNFYQTFFMPVHLDLIHSTIEAMVFSNAIKLLNGISISRNDLFDSTKTFEMTYEYK